MIFADLCYKNFERKAWQVYKKQVLKEQKTEFKKYGTEYFKKLQVLLKYQMRTQTLIKATTF